MRGLIKKDRYGLKLIVSILLIAIVLFFAIYFIWSWLQLNDLVIPLAEIMQHDYLSSDNSYILRFVNEKYIVFTTEDNRYIFDYNSIVYKDGIIQLNAENGERFLFAILTDNRIYNNTYNVVLYGL